MIASGNLNAGTVLTIILSVMLGAFSLAILGPQVERFVKATAASHKIFQTLQRIPCIDSLDESGEKPAGVKGNLELKRVSFIFPARPEGSISSSNLRLTTSNRVEEYQYFHSRREVHRHRWPVRVRQVDHPAASGTVL